MGKFTELKRKWAGAIVTYYYNRNYEKAVAEADRRHKEENTTIYVIDSHIRGRLLSTVNRKEFRWIKHKAQIMHKSKAFWSNKYNLDMLRRQAWYHTADGSGKNPITPKQKEVRRLAFINEGLKRARLIKTDKK